MRHKNYLEAFLNKVKKPVRMAAGLMLAGCVLLGGTGIVKAATVADVFDAKQYADDYADLKAAFDYDEEALLNHYLTYGINEKREVSGLIDVVKYREAYGDLDAAFGDDWDAYVNHFLTYGAYERRNSGTDFDALAYAERYSDLKETLGDNVLALYQHYLTSGKAEGRDAKTGDFVYAAPKKNLEDNSAGSGSDNAQKSEEGTYWEKEYDSKGNVTKETLRGADGSTIEVITREYDYKIISDGQMVKEELTNYVTGHTRQIHISYDIEFKMYDIVYYEEYDPDEGIYITIRAFSGDWGGYPLEIRDKNHTLIVEAALDENFELVTGSEVWYGEHLW